MTINRRGFIKTAATAGAAGMTLHPRWSAASDLGIQKNGNDRQVRAAAVQMTIRHGDVDANLETAEKLGRIAIQDGATWITFPEFFTSGFGAGNDPALQDAHRPVDGQPTALLRDLAKASGGAVGGSFLAQREKDTYNTYVLALPDGRTLTHDKDTPSMGDEASNYIAGDDDGFLAIAPNLNVGAALCWELIRVRTARRLRGRVDLVMAGSAYFDSETLADAVTRKKNAQILAEMPRTLAKLVGAPVVHANPVGRVVIGEYTKPDGKIQYEYMGNSQIVDATGRILACRDRKMGEGVVVHDVSIGSVRPAEDLPDSFWIPEVPELYTWAFGNRPDGSRIYYTFTRPHRNKP